MKDSFPQYKESNPREQYELIFVCQLFFPLHHSFNFVFIHQKVLLIGSSNFSFSSFVLSQFYFSLWTQLSSLPSNQLELFCQGDIISDLSFFFFFSLPSLSTDQTKLTNQSHFFLYSAPPPPPLFIAVFYFVSFC